jgi:hypothetical protein
MLWLAPHIADPIMNKTSDANRHHFRVSMSLSLAQMIMKPVLEELVEFNLLSS